MQIFNGTPVPVKARADGMLYLINPGAIVNIEQPHRGRTILDNYPALREVKHGDDLEELRKESLAVWCAHVRDQIREYNQFQLEQAKQGLKLAPPNHQLEALSRLMEEQTGEALEVSHDAAEGGDPMLAAIRSMGQAVKRIKADSPEKAKLAALLDELVKAKGGKDKHVEEERAELLDASDLSGETVTAAVRARRAGRIRHARQGKGSK
jgi:hypothetical protein